MDKNTNTSKVRELFFSIPEDKTIFDYMYQDKGQMKFDDAKYRGSIKINKDFIKRMNGDFMVFFNGKWKQVNEDNMMKIIKEKLQNLKLIYNIPIHNLKR